MLGRYFKQTIRHLQSQKGYSLINVVGLTIGITSFIVIAFWANTEISYDKFHKNHENIFRVNYKLYEEGVLEQHSAAAVPTIGPMLKKTYPEVVEYTRFTKREGVIQYEDVFFKEKKIFFAEPSFFSMFSFPLLSGQDTTGILAVNNAVISESAAKRYFRNENPVGKAITLNGNEKYFITAVAKDAPVNSHLKFDFLLSYQNLINTSRWNDTSWFGPSFYTYVKLVPKTNIKALEAKIPALVEEHLGDFMKSAFFLAEFEFINLVDIHLYSELQNELEINGSARQVKYMSLIALLVLFIAFINYINLSTSRSMERAKEVGVRKVLGAKGKDLLYQFLSEAFVFTLLACVLSIVIIIFILPMFEQLMESKILISWLLFPITLLALFTFSTLFTGVVPAIYLSKLTPSTFLRGKGNVRTKDMNRLRNGLVIFQFAISVILIASTFMINKQLNFLRNQKLGINIDQTLVVEGPKALNPENYHQLFESLKEELMKVPSINHVCVSTNVPGEEVKDQPVYGKLVEGVNTEKNIRMIGIDQHFIDTYGLKLIAGRNFDKSFNQTVNEVILNESALKYLDIGNPQEAIGQELTSNLGNARVIGVVNDYNQKSLKELPCPLVFSNRAWGNYISINANSENIKDAVATIEKQWQMKFPGNPFQYFFLDDYFHEQYRADVKAGKMFMTFSILAIFIACLGLLGLSTYNTSKRTKEIGVRKVNGATILEVVLLLNKDFIRWVLFAIVLGSPVSWYVMNKWMEGFAYKTNLSWWIFALAGIAAIGIAFLTVTFQSWKAASRNPIESLRYE